VESSSNNETTPIVSCSEEISHEMFSTKEMCVTSEMTCVTTHCDISSTSNASNTTNKWNECTQIEYFWNKRQEEKQSFPSSYASMISKSNGNDHGARPKIYNQVKVTAAGTSFSEDLTNWPLAFESSEGKLKLTVCTQQL
jgi:hypothetical protein